MAQFVGAKSNQEIVAALLVRVLAEEFDVSVQIGDAEKFIRASTEASA